MKKPLLCVLTLTLLGALLTACGGKTADEDATLSAAAETGGALTDDPRNQDGIGEKELLVVSFGTSYQDSRREDIGAIEEALAEAFPDWSVRRAFTSQIVIDHVRERDGEEIDSVSEALERATANGVRRLAILPTHLMAGFEYDELNRTLDEHLSRWPFDAGASGLPLLTKDEDFDVVADALIDLTKQYDDGKTAIVFMGHGTEADANAVYAKMQDVLTQKGAAHCYVGTVEATPSLDDVLAAVKNGDYRRVVLRPLMLVAGDHANNDMAGDEPDSWKSVFEAAGYEVECVLEGLGRVEAVQALYIAHAQAAIDELGG